MSHLKKNEYAQWSKERPGGKEENLEGLAAVVVERRECLKAGK